jgi:uncharacterized protein
MPRILAFAVVLLFAAGLVLAQRQRAEAPPAIPLHEYQPKSTLVVPQHPTPRAKFPVIDIHSHQRGTDPARLEKLIGEMDKLNIRILVNLSGGFGEQLAAGVKSFKTTQPDRFAVFANINFRDINEPGFGERAARQLEQDVKNGAQGLKIYKNLGMDLKYADGRRVPVDDPALAPIWEMCAKLKIPVLIHTGEPMQLFLPPDKHNERYLELFHHPERYRPPDRYPTFEALMAERDRMFAKHPKTTFIAAHLGFQGHDLAGMGRLFEKMPNMYVDLAAVIQDLGRQPYTAHDFLVKYQDRVLYGKDIYNVEEYPNNFRVLETRDEYFEYYRPYPGWKLYGLNLPDDVLKKIYYKNALKLVPGLSTAGFPK